MLDFRRFSWSGDSGLNLILIPTDVTHQSESFVTLDNNSISTLFRGLEAFKPMRFGDWDAAVDRSTTRREEEERRKRLLPILPPFVTQHYL